MNHSTSLGRNSSNDSLLWPIATAMLTMAGATAAAFAILLGPARAGAEALPAANPTPSVITVLHAEGAQIYECKADAVGNHVWQFREPIATLFQDHRTVGRHFAGPTWQLIDDSLVTAKVVAQAPGPRPSDIPLLTLKPISRHGSGLFAFVAKIERVNTRSGRLQGPCDTPGTFASVPYAADYVFSRAAD